MIKLKRLNNNYRIHTQNKKKINHLQVIMMTGLLWDLHEARQGYGLWVLGYYLSTIIIVFK